MRGASLVCGRRCTAGRPESARPDAPDGRAVGGCVRCAAGAAPIAARQFRRRSGNEWWPACRPSPPLPSCRRSGWWPMATSITPLASRRLGACTTRNVFFGHGALLKGVIKIAIGRLAARQQDHARSVTVQAMEECHLAEARFCKLQQADRVGVACRFRQQASRLVDDDEVAVVGDQPALVECGKGRGSTARWAVPPDRRCGPPRN